MDLSFAEDISGFGPSAMASGDPRLKYTEKAKEEGKGLDDQTVADTCLPQMRHDSGSGSASQLAMPLVVNTCEIDAVLIHACVLRVFQ
jgi:hypothetical protein